MPCVLRYLSRLVRPRQLDGHAEAAVDPARFKSRSRNTPFGGWRLRGGPWKTIVGGTVVSG